MAKPKKQITITFNKGEVKTNLDGIENFTEVIIALATLEGVAGGIMDIDKATLREAIDEVQEDLQAKLPEGVK